MRNPEYLKKCQLDKLFHLKVTKNLDKMNQERKC